MDWHFEDNQQGLRRLWQIKQALRLAASESYQDAFDQTLLSELTTEIETLLKHDSYVDDLKTLKNIELLPDSPANKSLKDFLTQFFGPSLKEIELSKQRQALIARAEHAENTAFTALAETANVGKQRDDALARVRELEKTLKSLQKGDK